MSARGGLSVAGAATGHAAAWDASRRAAAFAAARRHTRLVRLLRKVLPLACAVALVAVIVPARIPVPEGVDLSIARTTISNGAVVMHEPRLTGFDKQNRSYRVSAETASQQLTSPDKVDLIKVVAEIHAPDRGDVKLTAGAGALDNSEERLSLHDGVEVESSDGYRIVLREVDVFFKERHLASDAPVTIFYRQGQTSADRLRVTDGGKVVVMEGRVRTSYRAAATQERPVAGMAGAPAPLAGTLAAPTSAEAVQ